MAVAAWLVWRERGFKVPRSRCGSSSFQLVANALWPWLFFALHAGALSTAAEIVVLWLLIAATIFKFWPVSRLAALLLVPLSRMGNLRRRAYLVVVALESRSSWLGRQKLDFGLLSERKSP
jgi:hypothetical protein